MNNVTFRKALHLSALAGVGAVAFPTSSSAAEISLGMYMPFIIGGADSDNSAESQIGLGTTDTEFYVKGSETFENGVSVSVRFEFDAADGEANNTDEAEIEISGAFGLVSLGREDGPADLLNFGATNVKAWEFGSYDNTTGVPVNYSQYSGAPTNGNEAGLDSSDDVKIAYFTPRFAGLQIGASVSNSSEIISQTPATNARGFEAGVNYLRQLGEFEFGAAASYWTTDQSNDPQRYTLSAKAGYGGFLIAGSYADGQRPSGQDVTAWDIGLGYRIGPWSSHITYESGEADFHGIGTASGSAHLIHGGLAYNLGPGVTVGASIGVGSDEADQGSLNGGQSKDFTLFTTGIKVGF
jgi:outer membrane protein OmpU